MSPSSQPKLAKRALAALASVWLICSVALAVRLAFLWTQQRDIPHEVLANVPFAQETGNIAFSLAGGNGFANLFRQPTGPTAWLTPVYPFLLSLLFRVLGGFTFHSFLAAALLNILFSTATCIPIFLLGKRIGGLSCAVLAAWLWAIYPHAILIPVEWIWDTSLSALLAATLLLFTLRLGDAHHATSSRKSLLYGLLWGFALLTNPALGIALPFFLAWLFLRHRPSRLAWKLPAMALAVAILCCVPWTIRNYSAFHRLIPLRSNFSFELWLGNNDIFDPAAVNDTQRITRYAEARRYAQLGESAFMNEKWRIATQFIRTHPALTLRLTARRITATWLGTENPWQDFRSADSWFVRGVFLCNLLVLLGAISGLVILFVRRHPLAIPAAAFPLAFPLVYYITHTSLRYRHPADPILILLVSAAILFFTGHRISSESDSISSAP